MLKITLTRKISNRTCTLGMLSAEGTASQLYTLEGPIPLNFTNYKHSLLPPGTYPGCLKIVSFMIDEVVVDSPEIALDKVEWFPKAGFLPARGNTPRSGLIYTSDKLIDAFHIDTSRDATMKYLKFCKELYDRGDHNILFEVVEDHSAMLFSQQTEFTAEAERQRLIAEEKARQITAEIALTKILPNKTIEITNDSYQRIS